EPPVARPESPHRRRQGRGLSRWQALSRAYLAGAGVGPHRPVVEGGQLCPLRRFHRHAGGLIGAAASRGGIAKRGGRPLKQEAIMHAIVRVLIGAAIATWAAAANAQQIDWQKVDDAFGRKGTVGGDVHRYGFPRTDLQVSVDGVAIKPAFALGGWVA